jgi:hypothetical protein
VVGAVGTGVATGVGIGTGIGAGVRAVGIRAGAAGTDGDESSIRRPDLASGLLVERSAFKTGSALLRSSRP